MRSFMRILAVAALCLVAGAADAFSQTYYMSLRGGYNHPHDSEIQAGGVAGIDATFDAAAAAAAAFGFEWIDGWRFEGELAWRRSEFDSIDNIAVPDGNAEIYTTMLNIYYGMREGAGINPYLGAGAGASRLAISDLAVGAAAVDDYGVGLSWQGMAGVDLALSESWKLSLEYRYFAVDEVKLADSLGAPFKTDYQASIAMLGLRFGF
jgi:opacity protein-like surface antigen